MTLKLRRVISLWSARPQRVFIKALKWRRIVITSSVHNESAKVWKFQRLFQTDRVSDWSRFTDKHWQLPLWFLLFSSSFPKSACPTFGIFDVFLFCKVFSYRKIWGRTWQCLLMTDFYRKVNKFFQKLPSATPAWVDQVSISKHYLAWEKLTKSTVTNCCRHISNRGGRWTKVVTWKGSIKGNVSCF